MCGSTLIIDVHLSITASMNISPTLTYTGSISKRPDITGAPDQVFRFDIFLDCLIFGIRGNTDAAIGTINLGLLCIEYLFAPQIHYNLFGKPIKFIGNLSIKEGEFSLIKINVDSIRFFLSSRIRQQWIVPSLMDMKLPWSFSPLLTRQILLTPLLVPLCPTSSLPTLGSS
jgi:hypothetical protein